MSDDECQIGGFEHTDIPFSKKNGVSKKDSQFTKKTGSLSRKTNPFSKKTSVISRITSISKKTTSFTRKDNPFSNVSFFSKKDTPYSRLIVCPNWLLQENGSNLLTEAGEKIIY